MAQFTIRATDNLSKYRVTVRVYNIVDSIRSCCCFNIMWLLIFKVQPVRLKLWKLYKLFVQVLTRGLVVLDQIQQIPTNTLMKSFIHSFRVTSAMTPSITVLVSYVRPYDVRPMPAQRSVDDNEIVADSLKLDVSLRLRNQVSLTDQWRRIRLKFID